MDWGSTPRTPGTRCRAACSPPRASAAHACGSGPGVADGLCLLAPYPGSRPSVNVVERAGGADAWQASEADLQDPELRVWQWLQRPPPALPVFIGHGTEDRFADRIERVAERFPPASRHTVAGGHDWSAWLPLWEHFLEAGYFKV